MKNITLLSVIMLGLSACVKEQPQQPIEKTYDFNGRRYEHYSSAEYSQSRRAYSAIDFVSETSLLLYHGNDTIGFDSAWHRQDTFPYILRHAYRFQTDPGNEMLLLWTYPSESPFDISEFEYSLSKRVYVVDTTETYIRRFNEQYGDTFERVQ